MLCAFERPCMAQTQSSPGGQCQVVPSLLLRYHGDLKFELNCYTLGRYITSR